MIDRTDGLVAAPFAPLNKEGEMNLALIPEYAERLRQDGVSGVFVNGTTGEGASMTLNERMQVAEAWIAHAPSDFKVIVHVGHTCLSDCRCLTAHAAEKGATAVGALAPYFFKPETVHGLVEWCSEIAGAAPTLPFYYYHIPSMTGVELPMHEFLPEAAGRVPNLAGIKYTYEDLDDYQSCVEFDGGRFDILFGRDELLLEGLERGARGAVGSTYNFAAPLYLDIVKRYRAGEREEARKLQDQAVAMIEDVLSSGCGVGSLKAAMNERALNCGPVRPPLRMPE